jgi:sphingomyelin phosphodiesterase acid-like 3
MSFCAGFCRFVRTLGVISLTALGMVTLAGHALAASAGADDRFQAGNWPNSGRTVPGLFVSDIHFDPFHDPAKVSQLVDAPVERWAEILGSAPSATQAADFASLQTTCASSAADTQYSLLDSSVHAMQKKARNANFLVLSGDLMAHQFTCRYATIVPTGDQAGYTAFVGKTIRFVVKSLRKGFPGIPLYVALGNNDSDCGDYKLDAQSAFLEAAAKVMADIALPEDREEVLRQFTTGGYYTIRHPFPRVGTRVIVLNDVLLSPRFTNCSSNVDTAAGAAEIAWLSQQLEEARKRHEKAWVVGHIPPGIDPFFLSSAAQTFCAPGSTTVPTVFLSSNALGDVLHDYPDVVSLAVFAHTHMDEFRVVEAEGSGSVSGPAVPLKMMSSISPVDGNYPSFTIGEVNPFGGSLEDFTVIQASTKTGIDAVWSKEYSFRETYNVSSFSTEVLKKLIKKFQNDPEAQSADSQKYIDNYDVNNKPAWLTSEWPKYVCSLTHMTVDDFTACACTPR